MKTKAKKKPVLGKITPELEVSVCDGVPLIGWCDPYGSFKVGRETWEIAIAGGVKAIIVKPQDAKNWYAVSIEKLAPHVVRVLLAERKKRKL